MSDFKFYELKCQRCGGKLIQCEDGNFKCESCQKTWRSYVLDEYNDAYKASSNAIDDKILELVANQRSLLWEEVNRLNISNARVEEYCREILKYLPDDFYANFFMATCSKRGNAVAEFFEPLNLADIGQDDIVFLFKYLTARVKEEWILIADGLLSMVKDKNVYNKLREQFNEKKRDFDDCVFNPNYHRNVFACYASEDLPIVNKVVSALEGEGIKCFVAARNLQHGSGAEEEYNRDIQTAIQNCDMILFFSSAHSRNMYRDTYTKEISYIKNCIDDPATGRKMPRLEYIITRYQDTDRTSDDEFKAFFDGKERCETNDVKDVVRRVHKILEEKREAGGFAVQNVNGGTRDADLKRARGLAVEGNFAEAKEIYERLKRENPDDMAAYIGLIRVASKNYHEYFGEEVSRAVQVAQDMFGKGMGGYKIRCDAEYKAYDDARKQQLKKQESESAKEQRQWERENKRQEKEDRKEEKRQEKEERKRGNYSSNKRSGGGIAISKIDFATVGPVAWAILSAIGFIIAIIISVNTHNTYAKGCAIAAGISAVQTLIWFGCSRSDDPDLITDGLSLVEFFIGLGLVFTFIFMFAYYQETTIYVIFITIGYCLPPAIVSLCTKFEDEGAGIFFGGAGVIIIGIALLVLGLYYGFGDFKIKDGELVHFNGVTKTEVVVVPEGVTSIGSYAFYRNDIGISHNQVIEIVLPEGVTTIGEKAFSGCYNLTTVNMPESLTEIADSAFENCTNAVIDLPDSYAGSVGFVTSVKEYSIPDSHPTYYTDNGNILTRSDNCLIVAARDGTVPQNASSVASYAYRGIDSSVSVAFPSGVATVEEYTFYGCDAAKITIPSGVNIVEKYAFTSCGASEIVIEEGVTTIESGALTGCTPTSLTVPFVGCYKSATTAYFGDIFGTDSVTWFTTYKDTNGNRIPNDLTSVTVLGGEVYSSSFKGCKKITSITLGSDVTVLNDGAFTDCSALSSLYISEGITSIGSKICNSGSTIDVFYSGTSLSWEAITKDSAWDSGIKTVLHYECVF